MAFQCINIRQVPMKVLKPRPPATVFNTSNGTWRMLMHEKPCLIPIVKKLSKKCSKCFQFYAIIVIEHGFSMHSMAFQCSGHPFFNTSHGNWRMLMHKKPCLIPILRYSLERPQLRIQLCWGLTTRQPLSVILYRLPEKGRKEIEETVEEMKERDREERGTGMKMKKQK